MGRLTQITGRADVCCHVVEWYYDDVDSVNVSPEDMELLRRDAAEEAVRKATEDIVLGCCAGELCVGVPYANPTKKRPAEELHGAWTIVDWAKHDA